MFIETSLPKALKCHASSPTSVSLSKLDPNMPALDEEGTEAVLEEGAEVFFSPPRMPLY